MALFRPGPLVGAISGAMGGVVFVQGRQMQVVRPRPNPIQPGTSLQVSQQRAYAQCCLEWRGLSAADRLTWEVAARNVPFVDRLGRRRSYSPFNLFMAVNMRRAVSGLILLPYYYSISAYETEHSWYLDFRYGGPFLVCDNYTAVTNPPLAWVSGGRSFRSTPQAFYRRPGYLQYERYMVPDINIYSTFTERFGEVQRLEYVFAEVAYIIVGTPVPAVVSVVGQVPDEGVNECLNPDFEVDWTSGLPPDWSASGTATMDRQAANVFGDQLCAYCQVGAATGANMVYFRSGVGVIANRQYRLRFDMRVTAGTVSRVRVYLPGVGYYNFVLNVGVSDWTRYNYTMTSATGVSACLIQWVTDNPVTAQFSLDNVDWRTSP